MFNNKYFSLSRTDWQSMGCNWNASKCQRKNKTKNERQQQQRTSVGQPAKFQLDKNAGASREPKQMEGKNHSMPKHSLALTLTARSLTLCPFELQLQARAGEHSKFEMLFEPFSNLLSPWIWSGKLGKLTYLFGYRFQYLFEISKKNNK